MQRRDFLQLLAASSCAAPALFTDPSSVIADTGRAKIKVGQIGTKHAHAGGQMSTLRKLPDMYEVVGIVEPDDDRYRQISQQPTYRDIPRLSTTELLETPGLQVVAVETEVKDLLDTARLCLQTGKHIHLDKPAGESLDELAEIQQIAADQSLIIQMGYMFRYNPGFQFLFHAARNGWLGNIFEVHGVMSKKVNQQTRQQLAQYPGGSMFELGCHLIDPLLTLLGTPDDVTGFNRQTVAGDPLFDNMLAVFEYPSATCTIRSSLLEVDGGRRRQFVVCGDQGTIAIRPLETPKLTLTLESPQGDFSAGRHDVDLPKSAGRYHGAWEELAAAISGQAQFPYSYQHDYNVQKAILAASGLREWPNSNTDRQ